MEMAGRWWGHFCKICLLNVEFSVSLALDLAGCLLLFTSFELHFQFFFRVKEGFRPNWFECMMTGVRSCYDEGKRTAETLTMDYHRGADVEVTYIIPILIIILPILIN